MNAEKRGNRNDDGKVSLSLPQLEISLEECSTEPKEAYVESYEPQANDGDDAKRE